MKSPEEIAREICVHHRSETQKAMFNALLANDLQLPHQPYEPPTLYMAIIKAIREARAEGLEIAEDLVEAQHLTMVDQVLIDKIRHAADDMRKGKR